MANGAAFAGALVLAAQRHPALEIGVHLTRCSRAPRVLVRR